VAGYLWPAYLWQVSLIAMQALPQGLPFVQCGMSPELELEVVDLDVVVRVVVVCALAGAAELPALAAAGAEPPHSDFLAILPLASRHLPLASRL
jgi:hypothetical protein